MNYKCNECGHEFKSEEIASNINCPNCGSSDIGYNDIQESVSFSEYVKLIEEGKEFLNEGTLPTKCVNGLVRYPMYTLEQIRPSIEMVASWMGIDYNENYADNKELMGAYKSIMNAFSDAKIAYIQTLNRGLKGIK